MIRLLVRMASFFCGYSGHKFVTTDHAHYTIFKIVCTRCGLVYWDGGFEERS